MSEAQTLENPVTESDAGPSDVEARARAMGWKSREEFRNGAPDNWKDAEAFVRDGEEQLPVLRERNRYLTRQVDDLGKKHDQALTMLQEVTERSRKAEERAFERAKRELEAQRAEAVAAGDTARFQALDREVQELQRDAPKPAPAPPPAQSQVVDPLVTEWVGKESWFGQHADMRASAEAIHGAHIRQGMSLPDSLRETSRTIRAMYPDRFENSRRAAPAPVSSSTPGPSKKADPHSFDNLPADAKAAYTRYAKMLEGKGKPLTKEEWAADYDWD